MKLHATMAVALVGLAGCGGGGGSDTPPIRAEIDPGETFVAYDAAFTDADTFLRSRSNTAFFDDPTTPQVEPIVGVPDTDTATYSGFLEVTLDTVGDQTRLLGQATVLADYANDDMSGSAVAFVGQNNLGAFDAYTGTIELTNGQIFINDFDLDYAGTLTGNGSDVTLSGQLDGFFKADPIRGIIAEDDTPTADIGGATVTGDVRLAAEID